MAVHQVADGGFEIGFAEIGFRECRAKFPVIIDDDIKILIVAARHGAVRNVVGIGVAQAPRI